MSLSSFTTLETHFWKIKNGFILRIKNLRKLWLDSKQSSTYQPEVNFLENILFCRIQRGFFVTNYYNWAKLFVQCLQWAIGLFEVCTGRKKAVVLGMEFVHWFCYLHVANATRSWRWKRRFFNIQQIFQVWYL